MFYRPDDYSEGSLTHGIQEAIDKAWENDGGTVLLDRDDYRLDFNGHEPMLVVKSGVTLVGSGIPCTKIWANRWLEGRALVAAKGRHVGLHNLCLNVAGDSVGEHTTVLQGGGSQFHFENVLLIGKNRGGGVGWRTEGALSGRIVGAFFKSLDTGIHLTNAGVDSQRSNDITIDSCKWDGPVGRCIYVNSEVGTSAIALTVRNSAIEGGWIGIHVDEDYCQVQSFQNHYECSVANVLLNGWAPAYFHGDHFDGGAPVGRTAPLRRGQVEAEGMHDAYFGCDLNGDIIYNAGRARMYSPRHGERISNGQVIGEIANM